MMLSSATTASSAPGWGVGWACLMAISANANPCVTGPGSLEAGVMSSGTLPPRAGITASSSPGAIGGGCLVGQCIATLKGPEEQGGGR